MTDADVRRILRDVLDPEIGVNIVDLGLLYGIAVDGSTVGITMTMTSPTSPVARLSSGEVVASPDRRAARRHQSVVVRRRVWCCLTVRSS
jgi:metal-sulfur cluster biosynthetic enzyme